MEKLYEALDSLFEELLEESAKTDFIDKFGQDIFNSFEKAKQRLKNNGKSVDYQQYLKMTKEELVNFLASLYDDEKDSQKKRMILGTDKEIRGKYNYLGEKNGFKVYQPLDVVASMDLGVNTGWCTTGRYGHYGHPEFTPSLKDAKEHWDEYTSADIKFYYFLDSKTMYGEYAIALYPEILEVNGEYDTYYIKHANVEVYNAKDILDYSSIEKLPLDLIPEEIICEYSKLEKIEIKNGVLVKYRGQDSELTIPNSVTSIGDGAFSGCRSLKSVTIHTGVTSIGNYAFYECAVLTSIAIPDSVISIGECAFSGCSSLTSIVIPNSVTSIGDHAFYGCSSLTSIVIPNNVTSIDDSAFSYCNSLKSIVIPDSVTSIGNNAFYCCRWLESINIPDSIISIGESAFVGCTSLKSINIPNSVTSIGNHAFYHCYSLSSIDIPNSITSIGDYTFYGCTSLTSIDIPNSVTSIGNYTFCECDSLKSINIPNSVTSIGACAFQNCYFLTSISIPNSVTSIGSHAFYKGKSLVVKTNNNYVKEYCNQLGIKVKPLV